MHLTLSQLLRKLQGEIGGSPKIKAKSERGTGKMPWNGNILERD
jgi:hypothetical protein